MSNLIDKSALVAEIKRLKDEYLKHSRNKFCAEWSCGTLDNILSFLDTLEVKEVDCEKEIDGLTAGWIEGEEYGELQNINTCRCVTLEEVKEAMRCMFELGLNAQKGEEV